MLEIHNNTQLFFSVKNKTVVLPPDDELVELFYWSRDYLLSQGFEHYEVSSFAKPGFQSKHNKAYWQRKPYKGFGLGACSFDGNQRLQNEKNLLKYITTLQEPHASVEISNETITPEQKRIEVIMLGLRRITGVSHEEIMDGLSETEKKEKNELLLQLQSEQLIAAVDDRYILSPRGLVVENEIITKLS
jgi:oxygen-independent coproporphyrinogen-3 oxidase